MLVAVASRLAADLDREEMPAGAWVFRVGVPRGSCSDKWMGSGWTSSEERRTRRASSVWPVSRMRKSSVECFVSSGADAGGTLCATRAGADLGQILLGSPIARSQTHDGVAGNPNEMLQFIATATATSTLTLLEEAAGLELTSEGRRMMQPSMRLPQELETEKWGLDLSV